MANVLVTIVTGAAGTTAREQAFNAPAIETANARLEQVGPFRQDNPAASQANTALTLGATDASAPTSFIAGRAGTIVGLVARSNADLTAGTATFRPSKGGTVQGAGAATDSAILSDLVQSKVTEFPEASFISFAAGDLIGVMLATNSAYLPVTADHAAYLLIRWSPISA